MQRLHEKGFSAVEALVGIATVVLLVAIGAFIYSHNDKTNAAVILQRQQYIDKSIRDLTIENYTSLDSSLHKHGYLTKSLYLTTQSLITSYVEGNFTNNPVYGKLICVDQLPSSYTYGSVSVNSAGNAATLPVNVFVPSSVNPTRYTASWVKANGTWQLSSAECSQK